MIGLISCDSGHREYDYITTVKEMELAKHMPV